MKLKEQVYWLISGSTFHANKIGLSFFHVLSRLYCDTYIMTDDSGGSTWNGILADFYTLVRPAVFISYLKTFGNYMIPYNMGCITVVLCYCLLYINQKLNCCQETCSVIVMLPSDKLLNEKYKYIISERKPFILRVY